MPRQISHSLLGILSAGPMSGYDIEKFVANHMSFFWRESFGQIYPMLKSMAQQKLVQVRVEHNPGKVDRQIYSLTKTGEKEVRQWLAEPPPAPSPRNELVLKLFFGAFTEPQHLIPHVEAVRDRQQAALNQYAGLEAMLRAQHTNEAGLPFWLITLDYGKRYSRSLLEWSEASIASLGKLADGTTKKKSARAKPAQKRARKTT